ncbi:MAG: hypothetical protein K2X07_05795 [Caulobacteraceae bacterium]|nr:hypothetical protein [Caulobacteraceae bacterium]
MTSPVPTPASPEWLRPVVIGIALFTWLAVAFLAWRGDEWREAAFFAAFATICLSGVDFAVRPKGARSGPN